MYVIVRRYRLAGSGDELLRRIKSDFVPVVTALPGLVAYDVVDCGGSEAMSISYWTGKGEAERSSIVAREWISKSALGLVPFTPERLSGDVVLQVGNPPGRSTLARM